MSSPATDKRSWFDVVLLLQLAEQNTDESDDKTCCCSHRNYIVIISENWCVFCWSAATHWRICVSGVHPARSAAAISSLFADEAYAPVHREGGNKHCICRSVYPSVCPSVAYIANNSRTQRPSVPKFGSKVRHLRCDSHTSFKVKDQGHQAH